MAGPKSLTAFAVRLARARDAAGYSPAQLGALIGASPSTIRRWESGAFEPSLSQLVSLAAALDVTVGHLVEGTEPQAAAGFVGRLVALEAAVEELRNQG